ncbi:DNA-J related domain-containing protein [Thalassotalea profundi]|uniref:J domain-containing protein n=1 Tax=Thalassotalea profundi TaxID=2036687 RepID=A0ABQ3IPK0_9GAMM|nr:DNA-J related domain-containing protein [Thalassotalea profundi]GHE90593.1 hypothetical protein GCM10011501_20000 [Thalassotalea profundi]
MTALNPYLVAILDEIEQFLTCFPLCSEHEIIKHLQNEKIPPFDAFLLADMRDLFSAHFLCMHALYKLKVQYQQTNKYKLIIESIKVQRIALNETLDCNSGLKTAIETIDPLESYYLNLKHFFDTQEDEISDLLKSFWQKYRAQDSKQAAFNTLNLPNNADAKMIKAQYLRLAQIHHPDKGGSTEMFSKINQAKDILDKLF